MWQRLCHTQPVGARPLPPCTLRWRAGTVKHCRGGGGVTRFGLGIMQHSPYAGPTLPIGRFSGQLLLPPPCPAAPFPKADLDTCPRSAHRFSEPPGFVLTGNDADCAACIPMREKFFWQMKGFIKNFTGRQAVFLWDMSRIILFGFSGICCLSGQGHDIPMVE